MDLVSNQSPGGSPSPQPYAWSTSKTALTTYVIACEKGCTQHSEFVHDAVKMLRAYRPVPGSAGQDSWRPEASTWSMAPPDSGRVSWSMAGPGQELAHLPIPQTMQNHELLVIYVKLISQFKASLDGNPDPSNPYIKHHVPYCVQSPLLVHVATYTAACLLNETGHMGTTVAMAHKGFAIQQLNEHIRSTASPSDEGITGVIQLIVDEWYWGDTNELRAHLRGLREMIKLRGGFRTLGLHGLISKLAITSDVAIALSFEIIPFLQGGPEFEFLDNPQVPLRLALNTPFCPQLPRFASCDDVLHINPAVATILDDMRFLLATVLALPENASPKELQKVHSTSAWIYDRIRGLPPDGPAARRPSTATSPAASSSATASTPGFDARETPEGGDEHASPQTTRQPQPSRSRSRGQHHHPPTGRRPSFQASTQTSEPLDPRWEPPPDRASPPLPDSPDYIYQAVRLAALMYSQAIKLRRPFSLVVGTAEFTQLWTTTWRVPLSTWRQLLGVFNWLMLPLAPSGKATEHDRFVKAMLNVSLLQIGMDNWEIARG
ncbi:hypothetical protein B0H67DRAFT_599232 [Lasiosphaeris hirsuta]|uniref:Uncharacterized protein n=1 Tax=Lasiosphaeris hirsuta TaxID=260670 RepID=A0AA40AP93_9PEZI|nr:hypothetical protein B0H67DRAFT_599232 [Lasiosphaeris hirsuta]